MKKVSIQELKRSLSGIVAQVAAGESVLITRHRRPRALLVPVGPRHLHIGARMGDGTLRPLLRRGSDGAYLDALLDDRYGHHASDSES